VIDPTGPCSAARSPKPRNQDRECDIFSNLRIYSGLAGAMAVVRPQE
jgi:hypothetical protein